jgi:phage/plasmid-like protein (TIGR03299 family)
VNLYQNTMAWTGQKPWHKMGTEFTEAFTSEQAIEGAHLGYEVTKMPLYLADGTRAGDSFATVNGDTNDVLGIVGGRYEVLQNKDAFTFFDSLLVDAGARYETAGALGKGERIWLMARMPGALYPVKGDEVLPYCLLTNTHDGSGTVQVRFTLVRVVCQNTLTAALRGSKEIISIRHTKSAQGNLALAGMILKDYVTHFATMNDRLSLLAATPISDETMEEYLINVFGDPSEVESPATATRIQNKINAVQEHYERGMGANLPGVKGTLWGGYNAMIEWSDYEYPVKGGQDRTNSILFGAANEFRQTAFDKAMELVGVK